MSFLSSSAGRERAERLLALAGSTLDAPNHVAWREILRAHPELLSDEMQEVISEVLPLFEQAGDSALVAALPLVAIELRRARALGVDEAFRRRVVEDYLNSESWLEAAEVVQQYPMLLSSEVDAVFDQAQQQYEREADRLRLTSIAEHRALLERCRQVGTRQAFEEKRTRPGEIKPWQPRAEVDRLLDVVSGGDLPADRRVELLRRAVTLVDPAAKPELWVAVQVDLARALIDLHGTTAAAVEPLRAALSVARVDREPAAWAHAAYNLGASLIDAPDASRNDIEEALGLFRQLSEHRLADGPPDWVLQNAMGKAHTLLDHLDEGVACQQSALAAQPADAGPVEVARVQSDLGLALFRRAERDGTDLDPAIAALTAAASGLDRDRDPADWARVELNLGIVYGARAAEHGAPVVEEALRHLDAALGVLTPEAATTVWVQCALAKASLLLRGRLTAKPVESLDSVIELMQRAVAVVDRSSHRHAWLEARLHLAMASLFRTENPAADVERAVTALQEILSDIDDGDTSPVSPIQVKNLLGLALRQRVKGNAADNVESAIRVYTEALSMAQQQGNSPEEAVAEEGLGLSYFRRLYGDRADNVERAIEHYERALSALDQSRASVGWVEVASNLGAALTRRQMGDRDQNLARAATVLEAAVHRQGSYPVVRSQALHNLGNVYLELARSGSGGYLDRARRAFEEALLVRSRATMPFEWAETTSNLGLVYNNRDEGDDRERAITLLQAAAAVRTRETVPAGFAETQNNLGVALYGRRTGDRDHNLDAAVVALEAALSVYQELNSSAEIVRSASTLGDVQMVRDRWPEAAKAYTAALDAADAVYASSLLTDTRQAQAAEFGHVPLRAAAALARAGEPLNAAVALERGQARWLGLSLGRDRADLTAIRNLDAEAYEGYRRATERLRRLAEAERAENMILSGGRAAVPGQALRPGRDRRLTLRTEAEEATARFSDALRRIRTLPGMEQFLHPVDAREIARFAAGRAICYLAIRGAATVAIVVTEAGATAVDLPHVDPGDVGDLVVGVESSGASAGYVYGQLMGGEHLHRSLDEALPYLGERVVAPIAAHVSELGVDDVLLVPDSILGMFPLHAAPVDDTGRCLLDEFDVSYAPSVRVLAALGAVERRAERVLVGVGDPRNDLPYAKIELAVVAAHFADDGKHALVGEAATEQAMIQVLPGASHVHLACHGRYDPYNPLDSALLLAHDDVLTLRELLEGRRMAGVELVVASACQTAVADLVNLPDELMGLPAGFLHAGAATVLGSLWPVPDMSTALLMSRFYAHMLDADRPLAPRPALRKAALWLRDLTVRELVELGTRRLGRTSHGALDSLPAQLAPDVLARFGAAAPATRPFHHPQHWASFVLLGL